MGKFVRNQLPQQVILICCDGQIIEFVKSERYFKITDDILLFIYVYRVSTAIAFEHR